MNNKAVTISARKIKIDDLSKIEKNRNGKREIAVMI
jgi:hypothetical protein